MLRSSVAHKSALKIEPPTFLGVFAPLSVLYVRVSAAASLLKRHGEMDGESDGTSNSFENRASIQSNRDLDASKGRPEPTI